MQKDNWGFYYDGGFYFSPATAKYSHMDNGQPIFKDHNGNYAYLRKRNKQKFRFKSGEEFEKYMKEIYN